MQTILVTGANKGIGLAVVKSILLEQPGFKVLLGSRNLELGEKARANALAETGVDAENIEVLELDVADADSITMAAASVKEAGHQLQGVVNNAGIATGSLARILKVNVWGMQCVNERFVPLLPRGGRVVNVASASGPNYVAQCSSEWQRFFQSSLIEWAELDRFMQDCERMTGEEMLSRGLPEGGSYGLSKACVNLLTLINARENPNLIVNSCTPGYIFTDLTQEMTGATASSAAEHGMKQPADGAKVMMKLLFDPIDSTGWYYGSDGLRSPLDRYRAPGLPAYLG